MTDVAYDAAKSIFASLKSRYEAMKGVDQTMDWLVRKCGEITDQLEENKVAAAKNPRAVSDLSEQGQRLDALLTKLNAGGWKNQFKKFWSAKGHLEEIKDISERIDRALDSLGMTLTLSMCQSLNTVLHEMRLGFEQNQAAIEQVAGGVSALHLAVKQVQDQLQVQQQAPQGSRQEQEGRQRMEALLAHVQSVIEQGREQQEQGVAMAQMTQGEFQNLNLVMEQVLQGLAKQNSEAERQKWELSMRETRQNSQFALLQQ
eukprot:CAMPEP_0173443970 /NCGR_PEP_ID=MMETSP1357-20121228/31226_1 /TAXON_ID=77926 /ORGANISM="Hemiselmis rufescens, Strain PCC563" /LENGTH=258 /DNA_ID=CAMNT_0014409961 /DNA_START=97 /DNA_END=870 /DNA_ORIENTATION=+